MKTLVISDIHLSHIFDEKKFFFLKKLFSSYEKIILNGDFWDGYVTTFDRFISSKWSQLFPLLKSKGVIYLYGNHDQKQFNDERTTLFSVEQKDHHLLAVGTQTYHIEHGHRLMKTMDVTYPFSRRILYYINYIMHQIEYFLNIMGSPHRIVLKKANNKMKKKLRRMQFSHWYLCGHTHYEEIDESNKFANSGPNQFNKASYLIVDSAGLSLRTQRYK